MVANPLMHYHSIKIGGKLKLIPPGSNPSNPSCNQLEQGTENYLKHNIVESKRTLEANKYKRSISSKQFGK